MAHLKTSQVEAIPQPLGQTLHRLSFLPRLYALIGIIIVTIRSCNVRTPQAGLNRSSGRMAIAF
eukprot:COSAG01_NODE_44726_length_416_cov_0.744479_1_plen_63_part_01